MEKKETKTKKNTNVKNSTKKSTTKKVSKSEVKKEETKITKVEESKKESVKKVEVKPITKKQSTNDTDLGGDEIKKLLIIIGAVCAIMLIFYFITEGVLKNKKEEEKPETPEIKIESEIQYEQILMGAMLDQKEDSYYVFAYDEEDHLNSVYDEYFKIYEKVDEHLKVYRVNLSDDFNKSYIAEESYLEGSNINKIKVTGPTLIRVEEGAMYLSFEGTDEILGRLKYITE